MKRKNLISNKKSNRIKRPTAVWFIVFGVLILLFAAFIFFGIKAGEYAQKAKTGEVCAEYNTVYTEVKI